MRFIQFVSKVSKRLSINGRMYEFLKELPTTPPDLVLLTIRTH